MAMKTRDIWIVLFCAVLTGGLGLFVYMYYYQNKAPLGPKIHLSAKKYASKTPVVLKSLKVGDDLVFSADPSSKGAIATTLDNGTSSIPVIQANNTEFTNEVSLGQEIGNNITVFALTTIPKAGTSVGPAVNVGTDVTAYLGYNKAANQRVGAYVYVNDVSMDRGSVLSSPLSIDIGSPDGKSASLLVWRSSDSQLEAWFNPKLKKSGMGLVSDKYQIAGNTSKIASDGTLTIFSDHEAHQLHELLVYPRTLTDAELSEVYQYLQKQWPGTMSM